MVAGNVDHLQGNMKEDLEKVDQPTSDSQGR